MADPLTISLSSLGGAGGLAALIGIFRYAGLKLNSKRGVELCDERHKQINDNYAQLANRIQSGSAVCDERNKQADERYEHIQKDIAEIKSDVRITREKSESTMIALIKIESMLERNRKENP